MSKLNWSYRPYVQFANRNESLPYICALRPRKCGFSFDFIDKNISFPYSVYYRRRFSGQWQCVDNINIQKVDITNLLDYVDYEFYIESHDGRKSATRLVKTGECIGNVINYLHPEDTYFYFSGQYYASPSIIRLPSGKLLASYDIFKSNAPQCMNVIFESKDDGETWEYVCDLFPSFWGKLFIANNRLFMLSVSREYGDLLVGESKDEGHTWSNPTVIARGCGNGIAGFHRAPCVCVEKNGRLWFAVENGSWSEGFFKICLASVDLSKDILEDEAWEITEPYEYIPKDGKTSDRTIEGNPFIGNNGELFVLYRYGKSKAILTKADPNNPKKPLEFVQEVDLPIAHTKFEIQRANNGYLYAIGNLTKSDERVRRNVLVVYKSKDGIDWEYVKTVIDCNDYDKQYTGFQYPSYIMEGNKVILLSRTAFNGARSFHDSNMITLHKFEV